MFANPIGLVARIVALIVLTGVPVTAYGGLAGGPQVPARDEREVEDKRQQALLEAMRAIDPVLAEQPSEESVLEPGSVALIEARVDQLRSERKQQFKYLPWSHIKKMITFETVSEKEQFIATRAKNLQTVLDRAIGVHIPAQVATERMSLAKFRIGKAVRDLFPEASFTANVKSGHLTGDAYTSDNWRMHFRQPVFRGGVLWNTLFLEWSNLEIAKREYEKTISDLVADVSKAYFEYERARNVQRDQELLSEKARVQKQISDEKYSAKLISEIEKLNADSLFSQTQFDLETAEQELEVARLEVQKFLALQPTDPIEIDPLYHLESLRVESLKKNQRLTIPDGTKKFTNLLEELIELAYQHRSDLAVEASKLKAAQFAYRVALGKRLPQADFIMEFGELAEAFRVDTDDPNHRHEFRVGMEVNWNLGGNTLKYTYDHDQRAPSVTQFRSQRGARTRGNSFSAALLDDLGQFSSMIEAKISALEQVVELEKTERDVVREVKEAYFNFNKSLIQVESTYKRMHYRERSARLVQHRLERNEVQISDYLQAELDLMEERSRVYQAIADLFLSQAKLNRAIGIREYMPVEMLA